MPRLSTKFDIKPNMQRRSSFGHDGSARPSIAGSRSSSQGSLGTLSSKVDLYSLSSWSKSSHQLHGATSMIGSSFRGTSTKRWDGNRRTTTNWDSLRRVRGSHGNSPISILQSAY